VEFNDAIQLFVIPLVGITWWNLVARIKCLEGKINEFKKEFMPREMCALQHASLTRILDEKLTPISIKLDKICNGGSLGDLEKRVIELEKNL
jgi:hypothetical protein